MTDLDALDRELAELMKFREEKEIITVHYGPKGQFKRYWLLNEFGDVDREWQPTRNIEQAFRVVNYLSPEYDFYLNNEADPNKWEAEFVARYYEIWDRSLSHHVEDIDTPELAICLAALKIKENMNVS